VKKLTPKPKKIIVNHGENESVGIFVDLLRANKYRVVGPQNLEAVRLL